MTRRTGSYTQDHALPVGWLLLGWLALIIVLWPT